MHECTIDDIIWKYGRENKNAKVSKVEVIGLFGLYDYDVTFDREVNIFLGPQGVGKTTVLKMIHCILGRKFGYFRTVMFKSFYLTLTNEDNTSTYIKVIKHDECVDIYFNDDKFSYSESKCIIKDDIFIDSELEYISEEHLLGGNGRDSDFEFAYNMERCVKALNELLGNDKEFGYVLNDYSEMCDYGYYYIRDKRLGNKEVRFPYLSGSEKRLITIFHICEGLIHSPIRLKVLILDNPENSLTIETQRKLIGKIRELDNDLQVIITTNSPFIFDNAYDNKASLLEPIDKITEN